MARDKDSRQCSRGCMRAAASEVAVQRASRSDHTSERIRTEEGPYSKEGGRGRGGRQSIRPPERATEVRTGE